jgi:predicted metalloendopeptidase
MNLLAESNAKGEGDLLGFYVGADEKNSAQNIAVFSKLV